MSKNPLKENFLNVLNNLDKNSFTTKDFIDRLEKDYPRDWKRIIKKYGKGGKGSGNIFSSHSLVSQALKGLADIGVLLKLNYVNAPDGWGNPRIRVWKRAESPTKNPSSAMDDSNQDDTDNDDLQYRDIMARAVVRCEEVRRRVLVRAKGQCEFGSTLARDEQCNTFIKRDGKPYLEAHHIVKLSDDGEDKDTNVIALCANHHREAHSGKSWESLNKKFDKIVTKKMSK